MTPRDRFTAALECKPLTGCVPWWDLEFHLWDAFSDRRLILGEEFAALDSARRNDALKENAAAFEHAIGKVPFSAITIPTHFWHWAPGQLAYFILPDDARFAQMRALKERVGDRVAMVASGGGPVMSANYDPDFCERLFDDPEAIDREVEQRVLHGIEDAKRWRDAGADALFTASDIADNAGPFFNPAQMERWIFPAMERWSSSVKEMGMKPILHSDGNLTGYLERIAVTGISALQAIDPVAGMDLTASLAKVRGKMALAGNLDCGLLVLGTPDVVEETAFAMLQEHGSDPGWIFGASNAVQQEVPKENICAVIRAVNRHTKMAQTGVGA